MRLSPLFSFPTGMVSTTLKALASSLFAIFFLMSAAYLMTDLIVGEANAQSTAAGSNSADVINCSPAPCVLPPTQVSEGGAEVADAPIVADPVNPAHLLLGSLDGNCRSDLGFFTSSDGGSSWNRTCLTGGIGLYAPSNYPMVGYDRNGVAYIAAQFTHHTSSTFGLIGIQRSTDGINWSPFATAMNKGIAPYYPWLAVDTSVDSPYVNNLYVSAVVVGETRNSQYLDRLYVSHSSDSGKDWQVVAVAPAQLGLKQDFYTHMTIGKHGTVYLTWMYCEDGRNYPCSNDEASIVFSKSTDGGNTWSFPTLVATVALREELLPNSNVGIENRPSIGVDNSDGPHSGNLYVSMYNWTGTYLQVQVVRSTDGGITWSTPVPVAPPSDTHDQFFPCLSVSSTGLVGVSWLDRRNDPANIDYQAFAAISSDGGQTFPNVQLTEAFSDPNINGSGREHWMGDYSGNTWAGPDFVAAWMDSSNGVDMQDVIGGIRLK
jgi:hypothetical protein